MAVGQIGRRDRRHRGFGRDGAELVGVGWTVGVAVGNGRPSLLVDWLAQPSGWDSRILGRIGRHRGVWNRSIDRPEGVLLAPSVGFLGTLVGWITGCVWVGSAGAAEGAAFFFWIFWYTRSAVTTPSLDTLSAL